MSHEYEPDLSGDGASRRHRVSPTKPRTKASQSALRMVIVPGGEHPGSERKLWLKALQGRARSLQDGALFRLRRLLDSRCPLLVFAKGEQVVAVRRYLAAESEPCSSTDDEVLLLDRPLMRRRLRTQISAAIATFAAVNGACAQSTTAAGAAHSTLDPGATGAVEQSPQRRHGDRMLPGAGRVAFSVSAGVPYAALAEVNLGVSNWFSLGAGAAVSDKFNEWAVFARPRFLLAHPGPVEVVLQVPVLYYPKVERRGGWDWFLANPALLVRGPVTRSTCAYLGVGAALLSTTESLSSAFRDPKAEEPPLDWDFSERPAEQRHETVNGVWNTIHLGVDQALGRNWVVGFDSLLLLKGIDIAKDYSRKVGPPFVAEAGVSYVF